MNLDLCFSLNSSYLFIALRKNDEWIDYIQQENYRHHSENFVSHLKQILNKNNWNASEINNTYFISGPGSQTGMRVSLAFISGFLFISGKVKIYHINSLLFQAANNDCISVMTYNKAGNKYYATVLQKKKQILFTNKLITNEELNALQETFSGCAIYKNFEKINLLENYQLLKKDFILLSESELNELEDFIEI